MQATATSNETSGGSATETPSLTSGESTAGDGLVEVATGFQRFLEGLVASEGRLVASLVLAGALVVGIFVLPAVAGRVRSLLAETGQTDRAVRGVERASRYVPTSFAELLLRTAQLTVLVAVVTAFLVVWGVVDLSTTADDLRNAVGPNLYDAVKTVLIVAVAFVASDQLQRFIAKVARQVDGMTEHQEEILLRVGQVTIFVTLGATILAVWEVNVGGLLVGAGFLGIVVGFAARQTLGSLIAGFVLMFSRPFTIGDWVEIGDNQGVVTDITIFNTRLENFDGEFVVIPNDQVSDRSITNRSRKGLLRLRTDVGVDYEADVETARAVALDAMEDVDAVVTSPQPQVVPKAFGDSAILLELRYWIDHPSPPRKWRAVSAVVTAVKAAFDEEGITIPYPQRTVSGRDATAAAEDANGSLADGEADGDGIDASVGSVDDHPVREPDD
ncbi:Small-conductance mechanosensitive channel [Halomicrobium zhouii]|uniref:Small-conductance mechanosensitive channel n=1 Tax=Halomicrobium zhouii TaxID=767519 RepID=A0A1I6KR01_9EURY|nr:mechanosensitive ion channel family protein [Halomicrobium zhouii]SFR93611.1 Small-conductance mechanosensitive channel [Halomicrobium zhouii]